NARVLIKRFGSLQIEHTNTTTDSEGKFEVTGLQPVTYVLFPFLQGYAPLLRDLEDIQANVHRAGDSVTLVLTKGGVITGTVTNQAGEPVVGVNVRALMVDPSDSLSFPYNILGSADRTDDRGVYRIYGLQEGTFVVWAGGGGDPPRPTADPFDGDVPTYAPSSTRETAREIAVRAGAESNGVDIQYRGDSGHAISGNVITTERTNVSVITLLSASGPQWETRAFQSPADRGFMIQGVDDGDYYIVAMSHLGNSEFMFSDAKQLKVRGADVGGVQLVVQPSSSVTGRVVLEETKATECTDKQRLVLTETLFSAESGGINPLKGMLKFFLPRSNADERGNVSLKNLLPNRYYFTTEHFAKDWYLKSIMLTTGVKPVDAARSWTTLKPGERLNGLTITLAQGAASVRGQIALSEGETLPEKLHVYLVPAEKEGAEDPLRFYDTAVGADGKVAFDQVAPGRYLVLARVSGDESPTKLRSPDSTAYRTKLRREAEALKAEIELKPCQKVSDFNVRFKNQ
ncbi:MAG TPA: carboxypeptidase-like regulatory domain-containing protein, partial [Pyrinomonadaceae bacterium]|nr:carboxypeptidase-like regulatory domain-containing protein [Pyrinomonadaceae bacterium]